MKNDLINILSNSNKDIDNQKLMDYLAGKLSAAESHEVEKAMADNEFFNDAVEGLEKVGNKKKIEHLVEQMNRDLQKKLELKKSRRDRRRLKEYPWIYLAIVLILAIALVCFWVLYRLKNHG